MLKLVAYTLFVLGSLLLFTPRDTTDYLFSKIFFVIGSVLFLAVSLINPDSYETIAG